LGLLIKIQETVWTWNSLCLVHGNVREWMAVLRIKKEKTNTKASNKGECCHMKLVIIFPVYVLVVNP
jgi:hypothetical protein